MRLKLAILLLCVFSINLSGQTDDYRNQSQELLNKSFEEEAYVGASAGFAVNGEIKWLSAIGMSDEKKNESFSAQTLTRIASITKTMTAIGILQLFEQDKLKLDDPIQMYLPNFPKKGIADITIQQLLNHSSGIGGYQSGRESENKNQYNSFEEAMKIFENRALVAEPGTAFNYTTYGYLVLGAIIEKISGLSYEDYLKQNIWDKAGMNSTTTIESDLVSEVYHKNSRGKVKLVEATNLSDRIPGGGVYSNAEDILKFGIAILNNSLIKASTFQMMIKDAGLKKEGNGYGLGFYLYGVNPKYGNVVGHNGAQIGASTWLMLLPEQDAVVAVLSNTSGALNETFKLTNALFEEAIKAKK